MKYCSECASLVSLEIPEGDHRHRYVCASCQTIHYHNPKIIVGCIVEYDTNILLCRRAIQPRLGTWTIPAGFLENEETTAEGAKRETFEESLAKVNQLELFCLYNIPHISQLYMIYRAQMQNAEFGPTLESSEVKLVSEDQIPWGDIAFPVVTAALEHYLTQRAAGKFTLVNDTIDRRQQ